MDKTKITYILSNIDKSIAFEWIVEKIENLIDNLGYLYFNLNEKGSIKKVDRLIKSDFHNFLICNREITEFLNFKF